MSINLSTVQAKLKKNAPADHRDLEAYPVVKLFTPYANAVWLLSSVDPNNPDRAFGLCDLGLGEPELGYVSLVELNALEARAGILVEQDADFLSGTSLRLLLRAAKARGGGAP